MQVFLETRRLVLRRFTMADVDNLAGLDADPDVMHFVTGGRPTARDEIENEILPGFLAYYERGGTLAAVVGGGMPSAVTKLRAKVAQRVTIEEALAERQAASTPARL